MGFGPSVDILPARNGSIGGCTDEKTMQIISESKAVKCPENYGDYFDIWILMSPLWSKWDLALL
jgi:hypothetical protein